MDFYFFKTVTEKGRNRLKPLEGQFLYGEPVNTSWNVQADRAIRGFYPIGTVFGSAQLASRGTYYEAGDIFPIGIDEDMYKFDHHRPSTEMVNAYITFVGLSDSSEKKTRPEAAEKSSKEKRPTILDRLHNNRALNPPTAKDGFYVNPKDWYVLVRNILNQVNTMILGPTGTGKTELVTLICQQLDIPCHIYDMGSMYDPVAGLLGVHRLQKGGVSVFDYAQFTKDIQEPGVILLDELSRAPVTTNNILFPCLDNRRFLPVEMAGGDDLRRVPVHSECCFVATANVGAEYTGTMSMDRALINRFFPLELDYMPENEEIRVIQKKCHIQYADAKQIVAVANIVRNLYRKQELSSALSTRETLMAGDMIADGWSALEAMELVYLPLFEGTKVEGERSIVAKSLMTR